MEDDLYPRNIGSGIPIKDLSHQACLEKLHGLMEYDKLLAEQAELRENGIYRGIGVAGFIKGRPPARSAITALAAHGSPLRTPPP